MEPASELLTGTPQSLEAGQLLEAVTDAVMVEAQRVSSEGPFQADQDPMLEVLQKNDDTGETTMRIIDHSPGDSPDHATPSVVTDDLTPSPDAVALETSPMTTASSPVSPADFDSPVSSPTPTSSSDLHDPEVSAPNSPLSSRTSSSGTHSSGASEGQPENLESPEIVGDGREKHVMIDFSPEHRKGHKKHKGQKCRRCKKRRKGHKKPSQPEPRMERRDSLPMPTNTEAVIYMCGFLLTLVVLAALAASTRHLFKQRGVLVVSLRTVNPQGVPPSLVCGVSKLAGLANLASLCSHIIYTGDMDILSDYVDYTLLPTNAANFEAFRRLGNPSSNVPQLLASVPLRPLLQRLRDGVLWRRLGAGMARFVNNATVHGVELRLSPAAVLNVDVLVMIEITCKEMKESDPESILFLRLRYDMLLANHSIMERLVDCPDLVVFRAENHELNSKILRAPNPYRRYIGSDMAELFLLQELEKISLLRKPPVGQDWCVSFALGGLLFRYHMGLSFGDDAQTGPKEISLSEICEGYFDRRFEDLRTLSFYAMEHSKHTWVAFDDDWSLSRKAIFVQQRESPRLCLAVYHVELDDHREACGTGPAPVLHRLRSLVNGSTRR